MNLRSDFFVFLNAYRSPASYEVPVQTYFYQLTMGIAYIGIVLNKSVAPSLPTVMMTSPQRFGIEASFAIGEIVLERW